MLDCIKIVHLPEFNRVGNAFNNIFVNYIIIEQEFGHLTIWCQPLLNAKAWASSQSQHTKESLAGYLKFEGTTLFLFRNKSCISSHQKKGGSSIQCQGLIRQIAVIESESTIVLYLTTAFLHIVILAMRIFIQSIYMAVQGITKYLLYRLIDGSPEERSAKSIAKTAIRLHSKTSPLTASINMRI